MPSRSLFSTAFLATSSSCSSSSTHLRSAAAPIFYSSSALRARTPQIKLRSLSYPFSSTFPASRRAALSSYTKPIPTMEVELSAPNGKKWSQPLGLLINGEFVKSSNEQKLTSINPS